MTKLAMIAVSVVMVACGPRVLTNEDGGGGDDDAPVGPHTLSAVEITPTNSIIELDLDTPGSQAFTVTARYSDGVSEDITGSVTLTVANPAVGTMTGATLAIPGFATTGVQTSRIRADYEGLAGEAQITVVAYRKTGAMQDFFFVLPYQDTAGQMAKPLDFGTAVPALDVMFMMDTTGSMIGEINNLQTSLSGTIIPGIQQQVANSQFGVSSFEDFPITPHGQLQGELCWETLAKNDQPLNLFQVITNNVSAVQTAVGKLKTPGGNPIGCGGDWPEAAMEGLYQVATGQGLSTPSPTNVPPHTGGVGGVSFRPGTMPVVVTITDAMFHAPGENTVCPDNTAVTTAYNAAVTAVAHTRAQTKTALNNICARAVGVASIESGLSLTCTGQPDLEDFATATGARVPPVAWDIAARPAGCAAGQCCTGINGIGRAPDGDGLCPLVFRVSSDGTGLGTSIVTGIRMLTRFATFDVTSERDGVTTSIDGTPLPTPHTTADFIKQVTPTGYTLPPAPPVVPAPTFDTTTFRRVTPGTGVQFDVRAFNDFVPQTADAQIFRAVIRVVAGGCTDLDQREVLILVPPAPIVLL